MPKYYALRVLLQRSLVKEQETYMKKHGELPIGVIIIIQAKTNGANRAVHNQVGHPCEIDLRNFFFDYGLLTIALNYRLQWFEGISLQPEIEVTAQ